MLRLTPKRSFFARFSIRTQLLVLLVVIAAVLTLDRTRELAAHRGSEIQRAEREVFTTAQRGAQREAELVASARAVLALAAGNAQISVEAETSCQAPFRAATDVVAWLDIMSVVNTAGRLVCTTAAQPPVLDVSDRPFFQDAMRTRDFVISDFLISRLTSRPVVIAARPRLSGGKIDAVLVTSIDADWFSRVARAASGLETADVMLLNAAGEVISTSTRLSHWIGNHLGSDAGLWRVLNGPDGIIQTEAIDGVARILGHIRLPETRGILVVMRSKHEVLGNTRAEAWAALSKILVIVAACLLLVWFGGQNFVLRPLKAMGDAAQRLGEGDLGARVETRALAPELATLGNAFNAMSSLLAQRQEELKQANAQLAELAATDGLTGIANKRQFDEQLETEWRRACRGGTPISLLVMDVDHFKQFNDRYGHVTGDQCLQRVATVLKRACRRPGDLAARTGGEEFAVLLPGAQMEDAVAIAESIRSAVKSLKIPHQDSHVRYVTASLGVASFEPRPDQSSVALLHAADEALYRAKRAGRDRVTMHQGQVALAS